MGKRGPQPRGSGPATTIKSFSVSDDDLKLIKSAALAAGMSVSQFIVSAALYRAHMVLRLKKREKAA